VNRRNKLNSNTSEHRKPRMSILTENHIVNQAKYIQMQATDQYIPVIKTLHKTKSMPITTETDCMQNITNNTSQK